MRSSWSFNASLSCSSPSTFFSAALALLTSSNFWRRAFIWSPFSAIASLSALSSPLVTSASFFHCNSFASNSLSFALSVCWRANSLCSLSLMSFFRSVTSSFSFFPMFSNSACSNSDSRELPNTSSAAPPALAVTTSSPLFSPTSSSPTPPPPTPPCLAFRKEFIVLSLCSRMSLVLLLRREMISACAVESCICSCESCSSSLFFCSFKNETIALNCFNSSFAMLCLSFKSFNYIK